MEIFHLTDVIMCRFLLAALLCYCEVCPNSTCETDGYCFSSKSYERKTNTVTEASRLVWVCLDLQRFLFVFFQGYGHLFSSWPYFIYHSEALCKETQPSKKFCLSINWMTQKTIQSLYIIIISTCKIMTHLPFALWVSPLWVSHLL